jgi:hypothetical protein
MATNRDSASRRGDGKARDVDRDELRKVTETLKTVNVTRDEFLQATAEIRENVRQLEIQFQRIAQMQADIDSIKATVKKLTSK